MKNIIKGFAGWVAIGAAMTLGVNAAQHLWYEVLADKMDDGIEHVRNKMEKRKKPKEEEA